MATYYSSYSNEYRLRLDITQGTQNIANNTSVVSWTLYLQSGWKSMSVYSTYHATVNGVASPNTTQTNVSIGFNSLVTLGSGSTTVTHNADGTKSVPFSASFRTNSAVYSGGVLVTPSGTMTISGTFALTTIPRASQPRLNVSTQALGSAITISTNRASTSFTHTLTYSFGNQSGTIATGVGTSQSWTLPSGLASAIPNSTSGTGTITCRTYNGSTLIGSKTVSFTATVPNNATFQPTATISSIVQGTTLPSGVTAFVQNQSKAKVTSTGTGKYSATIKTYSVSVANIGTYTGSVITSGVLRNSGSVRITLTVTDSRGLKGSTYQDITVVSYSPPQIPTFSASRSESTPTNILATYNVSISSINNQNTKYFRIRSKTSDGSWVTATDSTQSYTFNGTQTIVSNPDKSYTIEMFVQDAFTSVTRTVQVGTAFTLIDFNESGKGMAIGKVSESDSLEVAMPMKAYQPITDGNTNNPYLYKSATTTITTFQNGWEGSITLSRYGDLVSIRGSLTKTGTVTNGTILTTIPVDFRPDFTVPIAVVKQNVSPYNSSLLFWLPYSGVLEIRTSDTIPANQSNANLRINQIYSV